MAIIGGETGMIILLPFGHRGLKSEQALSTPKLIRRSSSPKELGPMLWQGLCQNPSASCSAPKGTFSNFLEQASVSELLNEAFFCLCSAHVKAFCSAITFMWQNGDNQVWRSKGQTKHWVTRKSAPNSCITRNSLQLSFLQFPTLIVAATLLTLHAVVLHNPIFIKRTKMHRDHDKHHDKTHHSYRTETRRGQAALYAMAGTLQRVLITWGRKDTKSWESSR